MHIVAITTNRRYHGRVGELGVRGNKSSLGSYHRVSTKPMHSNSGASGNTNDVNGYALCVASFNFWYLSVPGRVSSKPRFKRASQNSERSNRQKCVHRSARGPQFEPNCDSPQLTTISLLPKDPPLSTTMIEQRTCYSYMSPSATPVHSSSIAAFVPEGRRHAGNQTQGVDYLDAADCPVLFPIGSSLNERDGLHAALRPKCCATETQYPARLSFRKFHG